MGQKILTISVAAYNMQQYLPRCLNSVLHTELLEDIEVLVVNDGSTDKTLEIAEEYEKKYPDTIKAINKQNGGHGSTINKGIELARGKYFKLLDADDWFDTQALIKLVDILKNSDYDLILNNNSVEFVYENRSALNIIKPKSLKYDTPYYLFKNEIEISSAHLPNINYKTRILKENNISVPNRRYYTDIEYCIYPFKYIDSVLYLDLCIYKYFVGREGQSISMKSYINHHEAFFNMTQNIITELITVRKNSFSLSSIIGYIENTARKMIRQYYKILMHYPDKKTAYQLFQDFETYLKSTNIDLYKTSKKGIRAFKVINALSLWEKTGINLIPLYNLFATWYHKIRK